MTWPRYSLSVSAFRNWWANVANISTLISKGSEYGNKPAVKSPHAQMPERTLFQDPLMDDIMRMAASKARAPGKRHISKVRSHQMLRWRLAWRKQPANAWKAQHPKQQGQLLAHQARTMAANIRNLPLIKRMDDEGRRRWSGGQIPLLEEDLKSDPGSCSGDGTLQGQHLKPRPFASHGRKVAPLHPRPSGNMKDRWGKEAMWTVGQTMDIKGCLPAAMKNRRDSRELDH